MSLKNEAQTAFEDTKTFYKEYVSGMSRKQLEKEFNQDTNRLKELYVEVLDSDEYRKRGNSLQKFYNFFLSLTKRLNPIRRLVFGISCMSFLLYYILEIVGLSWLIFYPLLVPIAFGGMNILLLIELLEKTDVKREIDLAREIQLSLLPATTYSKENLEICSFANTAKEVGGDYVDLIETEKGIYKIIADVSGKGLKAALYMVRMQALVHLIIEKNQPSPKELFLQLNDYVKSDVKDQTFVTACAAFFPNDKQEMVFARAGHNPPVFFSNERDATFELRTDGFALGMTTSHNLGNHLQEKKFHFKEGDTVFFYTDGLTEARNSFGEEYGSERLDSILSVYGSLHASTVIKKVQTSLENFIGDVKPADDITFTSVHRPE